MIAKVVISLAVICALSATSNAKTLLKDQTDCPTVCPTIYLPTCGTDGTNHQEFVNECQLKVHNCQVSGSLETPYEVTELDWCRTEKVDTLDDLLVKLGNLEMNKPECIACPLDFMPVCASNGKYRVQVSNECIMNAINCSLGEEGGDHFRVLRSGSC